MTGAPDQLYDDRRPAALRLYHAQTRKQPVAQTILCGTNSKRRESSRGDLWRTASLHVQFFRNVLTAHPDLTLVLPGSSEVVGKLHPQPRFRRAAECLRQSDSHLRADRGLAVDDVVEGLPSDAENLCTFSNGQSQGFEARVTYAASGVGRVFHGHGCSLLVPSGSRSVQHQTHLSLESGRQYASSPAL